MGSFSVCMLKYRVNTTETDKRHVVSFSNVRFSKVPMDFGFHDRDTAVLLRDTGTHTLCVDLNLHSKIGRRVDLARVRYGIFLQLERRRTSVSQQYRDHET